GPVILLDCSSHVRALHSFPTRRSSDLWKLQAAYMSQAYAIARKNSRIDMMLWFMIRDDPNIRTGWQSGLETIQNKKKPSWNVFRSEEHTSELQSRSDLVCRLLLEKKKK